MQWIYAPALHQITLSIRENMPFDHVSIIILCNYHHGCESYWLIAIYKTKPCSRFIPGLIVSSLTKIAKEISEGMLFQVFSSFSSVVLSGNNTLMNIRSQFSSSRFTGYEYIILQFPILRPWDVLVTIQKKKKKKKKKEKKKVATNTDNMTCSSWIHIASVHFMFKYTVKFRY